MYRGKEKGWMAMKINPTMERNRGRLVALQIVAALATQLGAYALVHAADSEAVTALPQHQVLLLVLLALLGALVVAAVLRSLFQRSLRGLVDATLRIARGEYATAQVTAGSAELDELSDALAKMRTDVAEREHRIRRDATHDALTNLPNRGAAYARLVAAIARPDSGRLGVSLVLIGIDRFKRINDSFGHAFGDRVLVEMAERLRAAKNPSELLARTGGDVFLLLLPAAEPKAAMLRARAVLEPLREPFAIEGARVQLSASAGVAVYPMHGSDAAELMRRADAAMLSAKRARCGVALFQTAQDDLHRRRQALTNDLPGAIGRNQLAVWYQPRMGLGGKREPQLEAMVRWHHPVFGLVDAEELSRLAEHAAFVRQITRYAILSVLSQCRDWARQGLTIDLSLRLSETDLFDPSLPEFVRGRLAAARPPVNLTLQFAESTLRIEGAASRLAELAAAGARLGVCEFGVGGMSVPQLKRLQLSELVIDRSFGLHLSADADDAVFVRATVGMAHEMKLDVVATGIRDQQALALLQGMGCDRARGPAVSPPLPVGDVVGWWFAFGAMNERQTLHRLAG